MAPSYGELRAAIIQYVKDVARIDRPTIVGPAKITGDQIRKHLERVGLLACPHAERQPIVHRACDIVHELYLERIIAPGTGSMDLSATGCLTWPSFRVTEHGRKALEKAEYSPYDAEGYLARLQSEIPDLDDTILQYLDEALKCKQLWCLLAAAVMIGCASEKAMLLLIEAFGNAISDDTKKAEFQERIERQWMISKKHKTLREWLNRTEKLPNTLAQGIPRSLDGVFTLIRETRNEAGHPAGGGIENDDIVANLTLFPGYCKHIYSLIEHFKASDAEVG